ncbi:MAG: DUF6931 family protein [Akkermansia sp.]
MSWNGEQWSKPLIFADKGNVEELVRVKGYEIPEDAESLLPTPKISGELFLSILCQTGYTEEAVKLLAYMINPRVGLWWVIRCYDAVKEDIRNDFERDGKTPAQRRAAKVDAMVKELTDTSDIDKLIEEHKAYMAEAEAKIKAEAEAAKPVNPAEAVMNEITQILDAIRKLDLPEEMKLPPTPESEAAFKKFEADLANAFKEGMADLIPAKETPMPPELERISGDNIFAKLQEKTDRIRPEIDKEMGKYFPLKLKGLPKPPSKASLNAAVDAARRWLLVPSDENGQLACNAAIKAKSGPESMLAYAAFWSSAVLVTETGRVPGNRALPPIGFNGVLSQLAQEEGGDLDYDARYLLFLRLGLECATGTSTWNINARESEKPATPEPAPTGNPWVRQGFGREL